MKKQTAMSIFGIVGISVLMFGFQNCAKVNTDAIAFKDMRSLTGGEVATLPVSGDSQDSDDSYSSDDDQTVVIDISNDDVTAAIADCKSGEYGQKVSELNLKFNHEDADVEADHVSELKGVFGTVVLRAGSDEASIDNIHVNHTNLVLCNFQKIGEIKGSHNRVIVVGGVVQELKINNSVISLVEATYLNQKGPHTVLKVYSAK